MVLSQTFRFHCLSAPQPWVNRCVLKNRMVLSPVVWWVSVPEDAKVGFIRANVEFYAMLLQPVEVGKLPSLEHRSGRSSKERPHHVPQDILPVGCDVLTECDGHGVSLVLSVMSCTLKFTARMAIVKWMSRGDKRMSCVVTCG